LIFNRGWYACGAASLAAAALVAIRVNRPWRDLILSCAAPALFWLIASIGVSHYVYDGSELYALKWIADCLPRAPRHWTSIHAGLDESSRLLALLFPGSESHPYDIFDPSEMTEPSIVRARRFSPTHSEPASWRELPLPDGASDAVFLIFCAHELRRHAARVQL